jgi:hypothetical protein
MLKVFDPRNVTLKDFGTEFQKIRRSSNPATTS